MISFLLEGEGKKGSIKIDDSSRNIQLTFAQYELLNETLNFYTDKKERHPDPGAVHLLQQYIVSRWKAQDRDFSHPQWPD